MPHLNEADLEAVTDALGRTPQGVIDVPVRRRNGLPVVITCYPLREDRGEMTPFPTFYWLVDPELCKQLADLERQGVVRQVEQQLAADNDLLAAYHEDHRRYIADRLQALPPVDRIRAGILKSRGIAGISDFNYVKCLHAHYAHHLVDRNTVGEILEADYGITQPTL